MSWEAVTALAAIVLPIAGAFAWIAYKHPKGYEALYLNLLFFTFSITAMTMTYLLLEARGVLYSLSLYLDNPGLRPDAELRADVMEGLSSFTRMAITLAAGLAVTLYLTFLRALHWILAGMPLTLKITKIE